MNLYTCLTLFLIFAQFSLSKKALIVVDVQGCFLPGGSLSVPGGNEVIPVINTLIDSSQFHLIVKTQDWHPSDHISFASQHPEHSLFEEIPLYYTRDGRLCQKDQTCDVQYTIKQKLWPDHCIMDTEAAEININIHYPPNRSKELILKKGSSKEIDSYSAFYDNGGFKQTQLHLKLQQHGIKEVYVVGLAYDYCVGFTALDSASLGYKTFVVEDATRGVAHEGVEKMKNELRNKGVTILYSSTVLGYNVFVWLGVMFCICSLISFLWIGARKDKSG